jgi:mono/diheme cytochrome c family protein
VEQRYGDADRLRATVYGGNRDVLQYQAFSQAFQAPATSAFQAFPAAEQPVRPGLRRFGKHGVACHALRAAFPVADQKKCPGPLVIPNSYSNWSITGG